MAIYGEIGEIPLSLKAFRLMLNYWYRVTELPDDTLAKKALLENVQLRTNWIMTVEKLIRILDLAELPENLALFNRKARKSITDKFITFWKKSKKDGCLSRIQFYDKVKEEFEFEKYLELPNFNERKMITKLRCSDHTLEIEKGRHDKIPKEERICSLRQRRC